MKWSCVTFTIAWSYQSECPDQSQCWSETDGTWPAKRKRSKSSCGR